MAMHFIGSILTITLSLLSASQLRSGTPVQAAEISFESPHPLEPAWRWNPPVRFG
jgi:hypothetical protein